MMELPGASTVYMSQCLKPFPAYFNGNDWFTPGVVAYYELCDKWNV
jgi:hypothetical protein